MKGRTRLPAWALSWVLALGVISVAALADPAKSADEKDRKAALAALVDKVRGQLAKWSQEEAAFGAGFAQGDAKPLVEGVRAELAETLDALRAEFQAELEAEKGSQRVDFLDGKLGEKEVLDHYGEVWGTARADAGAHLDRLVVLFHARPESFHLWLGILVGVWLATLVGFVVWGALKLDAKEGRVRPLLAVAITWVSLLLALIQMLQTGRVDATLAAAFTVVVGFYFGARALEGYLETRPIFRSKTTTPDGGEDLVEARQGATDLAKAELTARREDQTREAEAARRRADTALAEEARRATSMAFEKWLEQLRYEAPRGGGSGQAPAEPKRDAQGAPGDDPAVAGGATSPGGGPGAAPTTGQGPEEPQS